MKLDDSSPLMKQTMIILTDIDRFNSIKTIIYAMKSFDMKHLFSRFFRYYLSAWADKQPLEPLQYRLHLLHR
jgi:hypothetical protein